MVEKAYKEYVIFIKASMLHFSEEAANNSPEITPTELTEFATRLRSGGKLYAKMVDSNTLEVDQLCTVSLVITDNVGFCVIPWSEFCQQREEYKKSNAADLHPLMKYFNTAW